MPEWNPRHLGTIVTDPELGDNLSIFALQNLGMLSLIFLFWLYFGLAFLLLVFNSGPRIRKEVSNNIYLCVYLVELSKIQITSSLYFSIKLIKTHKQNTEFNWTVIKCFCEKNIKKISWSEVIQISLLTVLINSLRTDMNILIFWLLPTNWWNGRIFYTVS